MPVECQNEEAKWRLQKILGGTGWDYFAEPDEFF
jgi:hypothetical protein